MNDAYEEIARLMSLGQNAAVATIVRTKGSTPRGTGTQMVIRADGTTAGTIGGGCGEAEVWSEAMEALSSGLSRLVEVDLLHDDDAEGGRSCGGLMYVFIEPLKKVSS